MQYDIPVLVIIFNRPSLAKEVVNAIAKQRPKYLYIAADGPRNLKEKELEKCHETRELVLKSINWECEVKTLFRESNLGCGKSVSSAITWFFSHVEEGIILEDDCVPHNSFFPYCKELLLKYRYDTRISAISGNNFQPNQPMDLNTDYYFSVFPSSWGWATWKRSWENYSLFISDWSEINKSDVLNFLFKEKEYQLWWKQQFDHFHLNKPIDTWDFQFHYHSMVHKQLCVIPKSNVISNIGHGPEATHFRNPDSYVANLPTYELKFPLKHPAEISRNYEADVYIQNLLFGKSEIVSPYKKIKRLIKKFINT